MSISYNPETKKWSVNKLNTNNPTNRDTSITRQISITRERTVNKQVPISPNSPIMVWKQVKEPVTITVNVDDSQEQIVKKLRDAGLNVTPGYYGTGVKAEGLEELKNLQKEAKKRNETNKYNKLLNEEADKLNKDNAKVNASYDKVVSLASRTKGGDYKLIRDQIKALDVPDDTKEILENNYKTFYRNEKLKQWDPRLGAKPLYGDFDPNYYKKENPAVEEAWKKAVADDDIDITERYGENSFYLQHYTTQGKAAGKRGNAPEAKEAAQKYIETKPTDFDIQQARDLQLGVDIDSQTERLLSIPEVAAQLEKAKGGDEYWKELGKKYFLDPEKEDEFAVLFRLSERDEDKNIKLNYNVALVNGNETKTGITELEDALLKAAGEKSLIESKKFGALSQNVLKDTIAEIKKARQQEQMLSLFSGFEGFSEISNLGTDLSDSLLGGLNVGGVLGFVPGGEKMQESLEKGFESFNPFRNNTTYNWQAWFDKTIKEKYGQDVDLSYDVEKTTETGEKKKVSEQIKIDKQFANDFIEKYLSPRFNTSKSMDEFVSYVDVLKGEQNPFQTQEMLDALKLTADLRAQKYLDDIKKAEDRSFDSEFYFNPLGGPYKTGAYKTQAETVASDWEKAKKGDPYWAKQAYRFGTDLNNKEQFARLHFQVKGQGLNFDAAKDILTADSVAERIYGDILPALEKEALEQGTVFGQFIRPEDFAEEVLKGVDPTDKESWKKVLKNTGLDDFKGTIDELKAEITSTLRTSEGEDIRARIKELNDAREEVNQKTLGITYIERPTDVSPVDEEGETQLYQVFKKAGYGGTEDEFYTKFFPDTDRVEQQLLTKAAGGQKLEMEKLNLNDPFEAFGSLSGLFGDEEEEDTSTAKKKTDSNSYFRIGFEDDEEDAFSFDSEEDIFGGLSSLFKGFK